MGTFSSKLSCPPQKTLIRRLRQALMIGLAPAMIATGVQAQSGAMLEEVLVTATRRGDTDILTTPVAVTAITSSDVKQFGPRDLNDIAVMVPNLSAGTVSAFKSASFAMRGVAETSIIVYKESPVGVNIDDFVVNHVQTQNLEMFDIAQIEVLRGPQGTLFGKNTTGGTINVKTKRPVLDERDLEMSFEAGDYGTRKMTAALNIPLIEHTLGFRLAAMYLKSDGYYKNGAEYGPLNITGIGLGTPGGALNGQTGRGNGEDLGGDDVISLRAKLLWQPTDDFSALLQYEYIRDEGDSPPIVNEAPAGYAFNQWGFTKDRGDPIDNAGTSNQDSFLFEMSKGHIVDIDGIYLNMDWTVGDYTVHSVTGYREQDSHLPSSYGGEVDVTLFDATRDDERETFQQEVRLVSNFDGPFNFVAGGFYQTEDIDFCVIQTVGFVDLLLNGEPAFLSSNPLVLCNAQEATALATFVDGSYDLSDQLHISAGLRYTDEEKEWAGRPRIPFQNLNGTPDPKLTWDKIGGPLAAGNFKKYPTGVVRDKEDWQEITFRVNLAYDFSDDLFAYVGFSRGFKSGGYNDQVGTVLNPIPAQAARPTNPEIADSYEAGFKASLLDGRASFAATAFFVEYSDAQRTLNATFSTGQETLFFNAAELEVKGLELEGSWNVTDAFRLRGNAMFQDAEFKEFVADTDYDGVDDIDFSGKEPTRAPESMLTIDGTYTFQLAGGTVDLNIRMAYEDESVASYSDVNEKFDTTLDEKTVWDASATFRTSDEKYYVRALAKNFTDERYRLGSLSVANFWIMSAYGQPRYLGLEFGAKFDF